MQSGRTLATPSTTAEHGSARQARRVLYVNRVGFLGGVERVLVTLAAGVRRHGWAPLVACPEGDLATALRGEGVEVAPVGFDRMRITTNPLLLARYPGALWANGQRLRRLAEEARADLIHVHHPVGALYALPAARALGLPLVLHVHDGLPVRPLYQLALRAAVRAADRILCVSGTARDLVETVPVDPARVSVIHNGVDRAFLDRPHEPAAEVTGPGPHIGVFGVIEPRKGQHVFLEAAARIAGARPQARFWVVGPVALADKAGYRAELEALVAREGLADRVTFTGFRADVGRWMRAMDVVALTSVAHESLGMVLAEAMALGRPVVASAVGGTPEVVTDGVTGRLVPPNDPAALADAITGLLNGDRQAMGERAAADVRQRFSPDLFCGRVAAVYEEVMAEHGARRRARGVTVRAP